ncbi:MAG: hypothetical protein R3311_18955, partial [Oceanisphaera sp.]|nr:hypothetical protein [Oceanisphaera sp.]
MAINRRRFLYCTGLALCGSACFGVPLSFGGGRTDIRGRVLRGEAPAKPWKWSCEGFLYRRLENSIVQCLICP